MLLFSGSGLALSVIAYAMPPPPKWEALAVHAKFAVLPRALPLGELDAKRPERASPFAFSEFDIIQPVLEAGNSALSLCHLT